MSIAPSSFFVLSVSISRFYLHHKHRCSLYSFQWIPGWAEQKGEKSKEGEWKEDKEEGVRKEFHPRLDLFSFCLVPCFSSTRLFTLPKHSY